MLQLCCAARSSNSAVEGYGDHPAVHVPRTLSLPEFSRTNARTVELSLNLDSSLSSPATAGQQSNPRSYPHEDSRCLDSAGAVAHHWSRRRSRIGCADIHSADHDPSRGGAADQRLLQSERL